MFGENLKILSVKRKLPLNVVAKKAGISYNTILSYVNERRSLPNVETGYKIAKALGVSVEYLVTGKPSNTDMDTVINTVSQLKLLLTSVGKSMNIVTEFIDKNSSIVLDI